MAPKNRGLGRGLDALLFDNSLDGEESASVSSLSIGEIEPNRDQPRQTFDEEALNELASSIAEHGVLQPLIVRPMPDGGYQLVAGERRWRAARIAGLTEVPVIVKTLTDSEVSVIALIENLQRENLNPMEEAEGIQKLIDEFDFTQEQAAQKLGKSRSALTNTLRLMSLPEKVRDLVSDDFLSQGHARALLGINDKSKICDAADTVISKHLSVRETEKLVKSINSQSVPGSTRIHKRDPFFSEVELSISSSSGRKVSVKESKKGGKIEIEFFDKEDLQKIANLFED
ncbi:MAG: ParB/RepB/Spo0J family partition protein [Oscillospiraceae bacterium]|nr:ParB/RepB/Spo0J family partition protein [Oscillospiraceae bacterium]MDY3937476.1 ParB/RepB/Spo0J family partition protein [Oscillospiraceae bacterium]